MILRWDAGSCNPLTHNGALVWTTLLGSCNLFLHSTLIIFCNLVMDFVQAKAVQKISMVLTNEFHSQECMEMLIDLRWLLNKLSEELSSPKVELFQALVELSNSLSQDMVMVA